MTQKKTNDYGTGASEVRPSVNRAVVRAKKAAQKKETAEKKAKAKRVNAEKKAAAKNRKPTNIVLQYGDRSVNYRSVVENARRIWKEEHKRKASEMLSLDLYIKPEENRVYYVINGEIAGDFAL